jgi:hypothetical protein
VTLREKTLLAISEVHSGNGAEGERIADAAILALREWLEERGLAIVPKDPKLAMLDALGACAQRITIDPEDDQAWKATAFNGLSMYRAMIASAPDALKST